MQEENYFLVLLLRDEKATAVILREQNKNIIVTGINEEYFPTPIEDMDSPDLLAALDKTISRAEESLPPKIQTEKTIFGVKDDWVEGKKIKKEHLDTLKMLSKSLGLKPIGFIVISEAIAHQIQTEEGAPLSAIITEIGKYSLTLTLFRAGKLMETKTGKLDEPVSHAIDTLLKHFSSVEILPSRLILLNTQTDDKLTQQLLTHNWSKTLPFLHVPQVSFLTHNFDAKAAVYGAALQMEFNVIDITGLPTESIVSNGTVKEKSEADDLPLQDSPSEHKPDHNPEAAGSISLAQAEDFGFLKDQDVTTLPPPTAPTVPLEQAPFFSQLHPEEAAEITQNQDISMRNRTVKRGKLNLSFAGIAPFLTSFWQRIRQSMAVLSSRIPLPGRKKFLLLIPLVLFFLLGIPLLYSSLVRATVNLTIQAKNFDTTEAVVFTLGQVNAFKENSIAAKSVDVSVNGEENISTSGKKEVGEKAKGNVTLFNNNDFKKMLPAGTTLISSNNISFTLDSDVTVASAAGDEFSGTKPGTAQASITAQNIGTEANLPSNTRFTIGGSNSRIAAKNDSAFSGGSKKDVNVVAKLDRDKLLLQIQKNLEGKAKDELSKKMSGGEVLLPLPLQATVDKKEFNKNIGEEAKTLSAKVTLTYSGVAYLTEDMQNFAQHIIQSKTSQNSDIQAPVQTAVDNLKNNKNNTYAANVAIKAGLLPKLDKNTLIQSIQGKPLAEATSILKKIPQVLIVDIKISPNFPLLSGKLPGSAKNITLTTKINE